MQCCNSILWRGTAYQAHSTCRHFNSLASDSAQAGKSPQLMRGPLGRSKEIGVSVERDAEISLCGNYRYALKRQWNRQSPLVLFIGLNPSTADADSDDPTLRRCIRFAQASGYGGVVMANLFAYRATDPEVLKLVEDPVGPHNDDWLAQLRAEIEVAVAAWGNRGDFRGRARTVSARLGRLYCLGYTSRGAPRHPLYVRCTAELVDWTA
jgi:hypothetical protein